MIYLLWGLLNIGLFLCFIVICFKATKFIREKIGLLASVIFVFGLLSFIVPSNNDDHNKEPNSNQIKTWKFASEDSLRISEYHLVDIDLEKTLVSKYHLGIKYGEDKQRQLNIPISAYSLTTGFVSGTNWKPMSVMVNKTNDMHKLEYFVDGVVEWKLLGATVYSQQKIYKGIVVTK